MDMARVEMMAHVFAQAISLDRFAIRAKLISMDQIVTNVCPQFLYCIQLLKFTDCETTETCLGRGTCVGPLGTCNCSSAFLGAHCEQCSEHLYGLNCNTCMNFHSPQFCLFLIHTVDCDAATCSGNGACNVTSGDCICDSEWQGIACDTCSENHFGPVCQCISLPLLCHFKYKYIVLLN